MALTLTYQGFNYPAFYNGGYENADSLNALAATGANSVALEDEYGINVTTSMIVTDPNYTDSLASLGTTIKEAVADGQTVMVRPLIDFLDPAVDGGLTGSFRGYFNPADTNAFFASYKTMLVAQAQTAQANGAQLFCVGTEIDQLTGPQYLSQWTGIINAVKAVFTGKLTYSADWNDNTSPWQYGGTGLPLGTGNIATQVSFWHQLDFVGIDQYAPISNATNPDPTLAQLIAGWETAPTDPTALAVTGNQSLISYYEGLSAAIGKPLFFTEQGYEDATDAASQPFGSSTNVVDQALQAKLYQAFVTAWRAQNNGSLVGVNYWNWDPNAAETDPSGGPNFSPQANPAALAVIANEFAACYCPGTLVRTVKGDRAIETLVIGDLVVTASGAAEPVRWIGRRSYAGRQLAGRPHLLPIRIRAGAIGVGQPYQDLRVSPLHAMLLDGVLVPAWLLVNGTTVQQEAYGGQVDYLHLELARHDIILANGAPSETFVDDDSRWLFHNAGDYRARYGDAAPPPAAYCALRVDSGYQLEAIRQRINARAEQPAGAGHRG